MFFINLLLGKRAVVPTWLVKICSNTNVTAKYAAIPSWTAKSFKVENEIRITLLEICWKMVIIISNQTRTSFIVVNFKQVSRNSSSALKKADTYSQHSQKSKVELFPKIFKVFPLTTLIESFILDLWLCSKYTSAMYSNWQASAQSQEVYLESSRTSTMELYVNELRRQYVNVSYIENIVQLF